MEKTKEKIISLKIEKPTTLWDKIDSRYYGACFEVQDAIVKDIKVFLQRIKDRLKREEGFEGICQLIDEESGDFNG